MTGKALFRYLTSRKVGAELVSVKGSHHKVRVGSCSTIVPMHTYDLPAGTMRAIERDLEPCLGKGWLRKARGK